METLSVSADAFEFVSNCVLLRGLTRHEKQAAFDRVRIRDFAVGEPIFHIGSPGGNMMVVLRGTVRISTLSAEGRPIVRAILGVGEVFGEITLLDGKPRTADATALAACSLAVLDRADFVAFLECNPRAWHNIISVFCDRLRQTDVQVAELALLYDQTQDKNRQLAEVSRHKSRFFAAASHDLRQPLHSLGLFMAQLRDHVKSAEGSLLLGRIDTALGIMNDMFNALLDLSKLDAGALSPSVSEFPIAEVLTKVENTFSMIAAEKGLSFRLRPSNAWVRSDPLLLERIILNLVSNAVRYTACGGVIVGCRCREATMRVEVWDSGAGIPEEQQRNIFGEFYQLSKVEGGLGLGLSIVERLCGLLGHPIDLVSSPGKGSRFAVSLPRVQPRSHREPAACTRPSNDPLQDKLVIVIDNDQLVRDGMGGLLHSWGCRVLPVATLEGALARLTEHAPDLIISDYPLAGAQTGLDAIEQLRARCGEIPAFLISGDTAPERLREARESGYHLLYKPVRPMALRAMVSQVLKDRSSRPLHSN
jgi:signal transduction histidine kinase